MKSTWFCLDCVTLTELTVHGRCGNCNSNGVAYAEGLGFFPVNEVMELELLFAKQAPLQGGDANS